MIEFNTNTGNCFISDKQLAAQFGVSESTIKREIKKLDEELGYISRETKNVKGGRERIIKVNLSKIEEKLSSVNLSFDSEEKQNSQGSNCHLSSINLPLVKEQIDTIKDNIKDNLIDNNREALTAKAVKSSINYPVVKRRELLSYGVPYEEYEQGLVRIISTNKIVRVIGD